MFIKKLLSSRNNNMLTNIVCTVLLLVMCFQVESQKLCSNFKSENSCICKRITTDESVVETEADCIGIQLETITNLRPLTSDITRMDLSHNYIVKLVHNEDMFNNTELTTLNLSFNNINEIHEDFFKPISNLKTLILSHNDILTLDNNLMFDSFSKLKYLDLSFNQIKNIAPNIFSPLINLRYLDISYNDKNLGKLFNQQPDILVVYLKINANISELRLNNLDLNQIPQNIFTNLTNLKRLSLADNHFKEVPTVPYSVEYLDLSGADITEIHAKKFNYHSLKILKLQRLACLEIINKYAFYNLQALEELYITDCKNLKTFNEMIFGALSNNSVWSLKKLSLARNSLETLNFTYKYLFDKLEDVNINNNPWKCNCNLLWLNEVKNYSPNSDFRCSSPTSLTNKLIFGLTVEDLPLCYPERYKNRVHRILIPVLIMLVLILSGLILYLIYFAPHWRSNRGLGPNSPYSPTRLDDH